MPGSPDSSEASAVRALRLLALALIVVPLAGLGVLLAGNDGPGAGAPSGERTGDASGAERPEIGPATGADVVQYIAQRESALAEAGGDRWAVVSFGRYLTGDEARALLADLRVEALLVAAPGGLTATVTDLAGWVEAERRAAAEEREAIERLLPTVTDQEFIAAYEEDLARLRALEAALDVGDALVFGAVVRAPAERLRAVAAAPEVRLVDIGGAEPEVPLDRHRGLRPEETVQAGRPPLRP